MSDFSLDLRGAEEQMDFEEAFGGDVVLGVLDGTTPPAEWVGEVSEGKVLVLAIAGELSDLAAEFAPPIKDAGGRLMHFRGFLVVVPPGVDLDSSRL